MDSFGKSIDSFAGIIDSFYIKNANVNVALPPPGPPKNFFSLFSQRMISLPEKQKVVSEKLLILR